MDIQQSSSVPVQVDDLDGFPSEIVIALLVKKLGGRVEILFEDEEKFDPDTVLGMQFTDTSCILTLGEPQDDISE